MDNNISKSAIIETSTIGKNVTIKEFVVIRKDVVIGDNVTIHPFVVIEEGVEIGDGVEIFPGSYLGKVPKGAGATARPIEFKKFVKIGADCAIGPNAVVYYDVEIGNNTLLGDGASVREQVTIGHHCLISRYTTVSYNTSIGNNVKVMDSTYITGNCIIGNNVFIGMLVSTANDNELVSREYTEGLIIGPKIEDDVTIGNSAVLLPGIRVKKGGFVGANSVVSRDVEEYDMVVGIPAKAVRNLRENNER